MNLFNAIHDENDKTNHWIAIEGCVAKPNQEPTRQLRQKLDKALGELGRIDVQLANAIARLRSEIAAETHDNLNAYVAQAVEPGLREAITALADEITRARKFADEVIAEPDNAFLYARAARTDCQSDF